MLYPSTLEFISTISRA